MAMASKIKKRIVPRLHNLQNHEPPAVIGLIQERRPQIEALCREFQVSHLEVFGSAGKSNGLIPRTATWIFSLSLPRKPSHVWRNYIWT